MTKILLLSKEKQNNDNQVFVVGLKLIGDGSVSGKTAWMDKPYLNSDSCGISVCSDEQLETAIDFCKQNKCQLSVHAMGTNAIKRVVDRVYAEKDWLNQDRPYVRVEHITLPSQDSINKAVEKNTPFQEVLTIIGEEEDDGMDAMEAMKLWNERRRQK